MPILATATPSLTISYTVSQSDSTQTFSESTSVGYSAFTFSDGTGMGQINMGIKNTGYLPSGDTKIFDFDAFPKEVFNSSYDVSFTSRSQVGLVLNPERGVKGILITNTWEHPSGSFPSGFTTGELPYFTIAATGQAGFTGLFNDGSGGIQVMPSSTWAYTNYVGATPTIGYLGEGNFNNFLSLIDSGSGVPYEIIVVGVTGTGAT